jgi:hypothetical protein
MQLITKCITVRANDPDIKDVMSTLLHENNSKQGLKLGLPEINANATTLLIAGKSLHEVLKFSPCKVALKFPRSLFSETQRGFRLLKPAS